MSSTSKRIIFLGTPDFAVAVLNKLVTEKFNIVAVVTSPDKPAGRGQQLNQSSVKKYALEKNIPVLQPEKLKNEEFLNELKSYRADLQVVVAFRMLPEQVWNMPKHGTINLHASLLPKYRGAAPINWCIINGDTQTGITTFKLTHTIDTGNILLQQVIEIPNNYNAGDLHDKLMIAGAQLMVETLNGIFDNTIKELPQTDTQATHAPKIFKNTCIINWNLSAIEINNLIRGLSPYPTAYTELINNKNEIIFLKIFQSEIVIASTQTQAMPIGSIVSDGKNYVYIQTAKGLLSLVDIQIAGKKRMLIADLLRGFSIQQHKVNYTYTM